MTQQDSYARIDAHLPSDSFLVRILPHLDQVLINDTRFRSMLSMNDEAMCHAMPCCPMRRVFADKYSNPAVADRELHTVPNEIRGNRQHVPLRRRTSGVHKNVKREDDSIHLTTSRHNAVDARIVDSRHVDESDHVSMNPSYDLFGNPCLGKQASPTIMVPTVSVIHEARTLSYDFEKKSWLMYHRLKNCGLEVVSPKEEFSERPDDLSSYPIPFQNDEDQLFHMDEL